jgi:hypothetical protein
MGSPNPLSGLVPNMCVWCGVVVSWCGGLVVWCGLVWCGAVLPVGVGVGANTERRRGSRRVGSSLRVGD